jgi:hypothetical protein
LLRKIGFYVVWTMDGKIGGNSRMEALVAVYSD